jgi:hypothetical protein
MSVFPTPLLSLLSLLPDLITSGVAVGLQLVTCDERGDYLLRSKLLLSLWEPSCGDGSR